MDRDSIKKLAEAFISEGLASGDALAEAEERIAYFLKHHSFVDVHDVAELCREVAKIGVGAAKDETCESSIYATYLRAFTAAAVGRALLGAGGAFFVHTAAAAIGQRDGRVAFATDPLNKAFTMPKTRKALIAEVDALFDGDAPRVKPSVHVSATIDGAVAAANDDPPPYASGD